jgi:hypothetical protein
MDDTGRVTESKYTCPVKPLALAALLSPQARICITEQYNVFKYSRAPPINSLILLRRYVITLLCCR